MSYKMKWEVFSSIVIPMWSINFKIYHDYPLYIDTYMCVCVSMSLMYQEDLTTFCWVGKIDISI